MMRRATWVFACAFFTQVVVSAVAFADAGITVPLGAVGFGSTIVDSVNGHVFVSEPIANAVQVFDTSGNLVKTIAGQFGATGMAIHGSTLFVAQRNGGAIEKIDLATLTDQGLLAGGLVSPYRLAFAGGRLWTAVNYVGQRAQLASITLSGIVVTYPTLYYQPDLAASPGAPDMLFVSQDGLSPGSVYRLDVSGGAPVTAASNPFTNQQNIQDLAVSPDGARVIPASGYPYEFQELSASTLQPDGIIYPAQPYPSAVAVSPGNHGLVATGLNSGYSSPDISVFVLGQPAAIFTASTNQTNGTANVRPHGLAMSDDGLLLAAVTAEDVYVTQFSLHIFRIPALPPTPTTTSLASSTNPSAYGQAVTFTATVRPSDGGGSVAFYADGATTPIPSCETVALSPAGSGYEATCTTASLSGGAHSIKATYSGDDAFGGSSATITQTVERATTSLAATPVVVRVRPPQLYLFTLTATLTSNGSGLADQSIVFSAGGTTLCSSKTNAAGLATCSVLTRPDDVLATLLAAGYTVSYAGNTNYGPSSGSAGLIS